LQNIIVFFYPDAKGDYIIPPYAFLYLERAIRDLDLRVVILDEKLDTDWEQQVNKMAPEILMAGVSVVLGNQITGAVHFSGIIKQNGDIPVIWGGWFPTWKPEVCLNEEYADFVVSGQGEAGFSFIVRNLLESKSIVEEINHTTIKNLKFENVRNKVLISQVEAQDFNEWPDIRYDLIDIRKYVSYSEGKGILRYFATAGCPNRCNFCFLSSSWKGKWFSRPVEKVINDIRYFISESSDIQYIIFEDNDLFHDRNFILSFSHALINNNLNIQWSGSAHIGDFLKTYSEEDIKIMKLSGCRSIASGAESGDQQIIDLLNKNLLVSDIVRFVFLLSRYNITPCFSFMVLFPGNPQKDLLATLKLIMKLIRIDPSLVIFLNIYAPSINNIFLKRAIKSGYRPPESLAGFEKFELKPQNMPWITTSLLKKMKYFGLFYFRFYSKNLFRFSYRYNSLPEYIIHFLVWPFNKIRFYFGITNITFLGWLYCKIFIKKEKEWPANDSLNKSIIIQYEKK